MNIIGRYPISICTACVLHTIWAIGLFLEPNAINATALYTVLIIARNSNIAAMIYALVTVMAIAGVLGKRQKYRVAMILPQQVILWFSTVGAAHAMYLGQFADGVQRAHWFLIVDQIPIILITLGHTFALLLIGAQQEDVHAE